MEFHTASIEGSVPLKKTRLSCENQWINRSDSIPLEFPNLRFVCLPSIRSLPRQQVSDCSRDYTPSTNSSGSTNSTFLSDHKSRSASLSKAANMPPFVSAMTWAVTDGYSGSLMWGSIENEQREIASLTKIMTCFLALKLVKSSTELTLDAIIPVSLKAATVIGTSAHLKENDQLHLWDALHGLMLPSGNDAAYCIGEFLGTYLKGQSENLGKQKSPMSFFVAEMNRTAKELGLKNTVYGNAHGLPHVKNHSCARDVGALASVAMQDSVFSKIVNTSVYTCYIAQASEIYPYRKVRWYNTNRMLDLGWDGVKTGITNAAGPCLCGSIKRGQYWIIITVLGSRSMDRRWIEVQKLAKWAFIKLGIKDKML